MKKAEEKVQRILEEELENCKKMYRQKVGEKEEENEIINSQSDNSSEEGQTEERKRRGRKRQRDDIYMFQAKQRIKTLKEKLYY